MFIVLLHKKRCYTKQTIVVVEGLVSFWLIAMLFLSDMNKKWKWSGLPWQKSWHWSFLCCYPREIFETLHGDNCCCVISSHASFGDWPIFKAAMTLESQTGSIFFLQWNHVICRCSFRISITNLTEVFLWTLFKWVLQTLCEVLKLQSFSWELPSCAWPTFKIAGDIKGEENGQLYFLALIVSWVSMCTSCPLRFRAAYVHLPTLHRVS